MSFKVEHATTDHSSYRCIAVLVLKNVDSEGFHEIEALCREWKDSYFSQRNSTQLFIAQLHYSIKRCQVLMHAPADKYIYMMTAALFPNGRSCEKRVSLQYHDIISTMNLFNNMLS